MPNINVTDNISGLTNNLQKIRQQTHEAEVEAFRIEGMIRVFKSLHEVGVLEIPVPEKEQVEPPALENATEEVIDEDPAPVPEVEPSKE